MTSLLGLHSLSKSYGSVRLFQDLTFSIFAGDRIGLIGPNGSGKSTLLKILMGLDVQDSGSITRRNGLIVGYASQDPQFPDMTIEEVLLEGIPALQLDEMQTRARILLGKAKFEDPNAKASKLSGGWKKRLDIIRACLKEPDILLLDEPTNHLDLEGILWLEEFLLRQKMGYMIISHDRYFLENVSNKIIELNRCYPEGVFVSDGNLTDFLNLKEQFLEGQAKREQSLRSVARGEVDWLRRSPKARTTKSVSRIKRANQLLDELSSVEKRNVTRQVAIEFSASERETRKLLVAKNLAKSYEDKVLFKGIDLVLSPGSRLGIMGKNGTGKTTLLKVLAGQSPATQGTRKCAQDLKLVYFDQHREPLASNLSLKEALCPVGEMVCYNGQYIHVNGWAKKFLFSPDRLTLPIGCLSGGERARILLAKLMLEPADILFLDEPTNDLDIPTLEVMEESLKEFPGALVLISHDRCLVDRVCTQILGLGSDTDAEFFADYAQWEEACLKKPTQQPKKEAAEKPKAVVATPKKLSYMEQKELSSIEAKIEAAEKELSTLEKQSGDPSLQTDPQKSHELYALLGAAQKSVETLYERWQQLLNKA